MFKKASAIHRAAAVLTLGSALLVAQNDAAHAQAPQDNFRWRQMTITVAFSAGGNYDVYARLLSRHINRHLPGNPNVVVSNMPGAGGLKMANHMYNTAPKDGSEIGVIPRALPTEPLLRKETNARFEPDKFNWIGSMNKEVAVLVFWHSRPSACRMCCPERKSGRRDRRDQRRGDVLPDREPTARFAAQGHSGVSGRAGNSPRHGKG